MAEQNGTHEWVMPKVEVGQLVRWNWNRPGPGASVGIVLSVSQNTINLSLHVQGIKDHVEKTGVRHADDPFLLRSPEHESGVWSLLPRDERINQMLEAFPTLLEQKLNPMPDSVRSLMSKAAAE